MTAREAILSAVRANRPTPAVDIPEVPTSTDHSQVEGGIGYSGHLADLAEVGGFPAEGDPVVPYFVKHLDAMGGRSFEVGGAASAAAKLAELFPDAKVVCSATPEIPGTRRAGDVADPHALKDVDVGVVRSRLGVAEAGAVWLDQGDLTHPALGVLAQHLVVLLDPAAIVPTLHDAYGGRLDPSASPYGVFMAGPSATGDIEGVIIHGAQGARTLTVMLLAAPSPDSTEAPPAAR